MMGPIMATAAAARPAPRAHGINICTADGPVWRLFVMFLIPLMISNILQAASQTFSLVFLGRLIGVDALASVSAVFPVIFLLFSFLIGVGSGSSVLIGQAHGAGDAHRVKKVAGTVLGATLAFGIFCAIVGPAISPSILAWLRTPPNILPQAIVYARVVFLTSPVIFPYIIYTSILRGAGDSKTPLYSLVLSTLLSLLFTPAFILGWFGLPKLGIVSAAVGALLSNAVAFAGFLAWLSYKDHPLRFDRETARDMLVDWKILAQVLKIGVPTGLQVIMVSLAEIAVLSFVNRFGSTATAAYGAVNQIVSYVQFPAISVGIAASIFAAQAIGGRREDLLGKVVHAAVGLNYLIGGAIIAACYVFSRTILGWFITDLHTLEIAHTLLMVTLWSYLIFGNSVAISWVVRGSGDVVIPMINGIVGIWAVEVPAAYLLMHRYGLVGVWLGYPISFAVVLALQYGYYTFVWKKRTHERLA
jgi:putative MATE family efflux protein